MSKKYEYRVTWEIDIDADTPEQAAREARRIQLDPESIADIFDVVNRKTKEESQIDLSEIDSED